MAKILKIDEFIKESNNQTDDMDKCYLENRTEKFNNRMFHYKSVFFFLVSACHSFLCLLYAHP